MDCPHCAAPDPYQLGRRTALGYRTFRCRACTRTSNERTGTAFKYPTDVVLLVVRWRLQYTLSLRDLAAMFLERGITFTHEAAREWEERFAPLLTERLRGTRRGLAGTRWFVDETYVRVQGRLCYLYRAIDRDGNLVDSMLSEHRDLDAARRFFAQAIEVVGHGPAQRLCYLYRAIDRDGNLVDSMLSEHRDLDAARRFFAQAIEVVGHGPAQVTTDGHASLPKGQPGGRGGGSRAPLQSIPEQPAGAGPSGDQGALPPDARLRLLCVGISLLPGLRRTAGPLPHAAGDGRGGAAGGAAAAVCRTAGGAGYPPGRVGRRAPAGTACEST